jgi:hypothetical protein
MDLEKEIKKVCDGCSESTRKTYAASIRRLAKYAGLDEVPTTKTWIWGKRGETLIKQIKRDLPVSKSRHLFNAGNVLTQIYGGRLVSWKTAMTESSQSYSKERLKQKKSPKEATNWPKTGYSSLHAAAILQKKLVTSLLNKKELNHSEAYKVQKYIVLLLYANVALRLDPASFYLKKDPVKNTLLRPKGKRNFVITMRSYKTAKSRGETVIELKPGISRAIAKFLQQVKRDHDYLLAGANGTKLTKSGLSKLILRTTAKLLNKRIGATLIRVLKATSAAKSIKLSTELQNEMMHSQRTQATYVRK